MIDSIIANIKKLVSIRRNKLFKDSSWLLIGRFLQILCQTFYFIFLARFLGAEDYGVFEGVKAIWTIFFPFIGLGFNDILIQEVSRKPERFSQQWGNSLVVIFGSTLVALITLLPVVIILLPAVPPAFIGLLLLSDFIGLKLSVCGGSAFVSVGKFKQATLYGLMYPYSKFAAVMALPLFPADQRLIAWGGLYFISSIIPSVLVVLFVNRFVAKPSFNLKGFAPSQLKQGFFFSLSESATNINSQVDRAMLLSFSGSTVAGIYGAGYRFIDMGFIPVISVLGACYPRFFKHGEEGIKGTLRFARKLIPLALVYGLVVGIALVLFSPFVGYVLGEEFAESSQVLIWLSPVVVISALQYLAADSLTGAGFQRSRSFVQVAAAALNIGLNLYLIPLYSWQGAIAATLASETFKLIALWIIVGLLYRQANRAARS